MAANQHIDLSENNSAALVSTVIFFMALSWFSVGLRTYTRAFLMKSYQLDDWLMLIGQVCPPTGFLSSSSSRFHRGFSLCLALLFSKESKLGSADTMKL